MIDDIKTKFDVNVSRKVNLSDGPKPPTELESVLVEIIEGMFKTSPRGDCIAAFPVRPGRP